MATEAPPTQMFCLSQMKADVQNHFVSERRQTEGSHTGIIMNCESSKAAPAEFSYKNMLEIIFSFFFAFVVASIQNADACDLCRFNIGDVTGHLRAGQRCFMKRPKPNNIKNLFKNESKFKLSHPFCNSYMACFSLITLPVITTCSN